MEIVTSPQLPGLPAWTRLLVGLAVVGPVTLLGVLPVGLGLDRYVVDGRDMEPAIPHGSVVLERPVPVGALRVGDVVTFRHPDRARDQDLSTERVVAVTGREVRTRSDARPGVTASVLPLDAPSQARVVATLPHLGHLYLVLGQPGVFGPLLGVPLVALLVLVGARGRRAGSGVAP